MEILYENNALLVCVKPPGAVSEQTPDHTGFANLVEEYTGTYVGVVHRLDRGVGGVMVYAKTPAAAASLSESIRTQKFRKEYLAIVHGTPSPDAGELRDWLFHDRLQNKSFAVDRARKGAKEAVLRYKTLSVREEGAGAKTLLHISLQTGRTHQIRVQFASRRHPLLGDRKYGSPLRCPIALYAAHLSFPEPESGALLSFTSLPPLCEAWEAFSDVLPDSLT